MWEIANTSIFGLHSAARAAVEDELYYRTALRKLRNVLGTATGISDILDGVVIARVERVLDVGCGAGQTLFPLAVSEGAFGVGVDISEMGLRLAREFYATHLPHAKITFLRAKAESLPFPAESFDVVNCRLALPYMNNARAFAEIARVLRPGGIFLLKIHHARYYLHMLWQGLTSRELSSTLHGARVLVAGTLYHATGQQPRLKILNESYQTRWLLRRELTKHGLVMDREQSRTNKLTPAFVIRKDVRVR